MWHSGDEDGLQSQRFGVQIQVSTKKIKKIGGGARSRDRVRGSIGLGIGLGIGIGGLIGLAIRIGLGVVVSVLLFLRNTPLQKKWKNHLDRRKLTS